KIFIFETTVDNHKNAFACSGYRRAAQNIKVPPTASRRAYGHLPNEKQSPSNPPKNTANTQQQRPTHHCKAPPPPPKGREQHRFQ
ncbi:hypothetical protein AAY21_005383, partial [Escherichia coli]